jgi:signal transduction histidine kinase
MAILLAAACACLTAASAEPKRVMLLHSFGREVRPWSDYARSIRSELERQSPWALDITDHSVESARTGDGDPEIPFVQYLQALFAKRPLDLIISVGAPAAGFVQRHRSQLFATTPMLLTVVEERRVQYAALSANDAVVPVRIDYPAAFENILRALPDTKNIAVVVGASPIEQFWHGEIAKAAESFAGRVAFTFYSDLSFDDILKRAAELPPHSAIFWELMIVDAAGVVHDDDTAFLRLHAAANAPIFGYYEPNIGQGLVGGPYNGVLGSSRVTAAVAVRILGGETAGDIRVPPIGFATPKFDWREMQRWGIKESSLPSGSEIEFRDPTLWDQYPGQIVAIGVAIFLQALLIWWLIYEHRRRNQAEIQSRSTLADLTHLNRVATAGELSGSIAHEVNQPLTSIVLTAAAGLRRLRADPPDLDKVEDALTHIASAGHRASDIVTSLRAMFKKEAAVRTAININDLVLTVLEIVRIDLQKNGIGLQLTLDETLPLLEGDKVQLQQVVLNLVMNAIESMQSVQPRVLRVESRRDKADMVHVSVEDTGTGIDPASLNRLFKPLFTTKARGMGMGLSICRSIIESHNGRIWVELGGQRGSIFQFDLPVAAAEPNRPEDLRQRLP